MVAKKPRAKSPRTDADFDADGEPRAISGTYQMRERMTLPWIFFLWDLFLSTSSPRVSLMTMGEPILTGQTYSQTLPKPKVRGGGTA